MNFDELLEIVGREPVFESGLLLVGDVQPAHVRRQLSRWVESGRLHQLRRGLYALAPPYRKVTPHPFLVANRLVRGSYVSLQSALGFHGWIPEAVSEITSVTAGRPGCWQTPLGVYSYRHLQEELFDGFNWRDLGGGQYAFVASPEKALLDLVHLTPGGDRRAYLAELRLQHLETLRLDELRRLAHGSGKPKLLRAAEHIAHLAREEALAYEIL